MSRSSKKATTSQHPMTRPRGNPPPTPTSAPRHQQTRRWSSSHTRRSWLPALSLVPLILLHQTQPGVLVQAQTDGDTSGTDENKVPLRVTNNCPETIWPGIGTQNGVGPGTGGFELDQGKTMAFLVGATWQGRIWGRTNCTFNDDGSGPGNTKVSLPGWDVAGQACSTGDCFGVLDCVYTGAVPVTLAEFNLRGGSNMDQTFYDISLVDGYNLPLGIVYIPAGNTSNIPPNLTNPTCVATAGFLYAPSRTGETYTNETYPTPWESKQTNTQVASWCPWDLQVWPPVKPGDGVYPYPDDDVQRPVFDPCLSACAATGAAEDCCTGDYNSPDTCRASLYSQNAKSVCPDAYSFAFDDQTSTFIIPAGGGWEVVFCPEGRSTDILATFGDILSEVGSSGGNVSDSVLRKARNVSFIDESDSGGAGAAANLVAGLWTVVVGAVLVQVLSSL